MTDRTDLVGCPCCGEFMEPELVACWQCYRLSNRLTPGTWICRHDHGDERHASTGTFTITEADVDRWDEARNKRSPFMAPSHWPSHDGLDRFGNEDDGRVGGCPTDTVGGL